MIYDVRGFFLSPGFYTNTFIKEAFISFFTSVSESDKLRFLCRDKKKNDAVFERERLNNMRKVPTQ